MRRIGDHVHMNIPGMLDNFMAMKTIKWRGVF